MKKYLLLLALPILTVGCEPSKSQKDIAAEQQYIKDIVAEQQYIAANHCIQDKSTRYPSGEIVISYKCDNNAMIYTSNLDKDNDNSIFYHGGQSADSGSFATGYIVGHVAANGYRSSSSRASSARVSSSGGEE